MTKPTRSFPCLAGTHDLCARRWKKGEEDCICGCPCHEEEKHVAVLGVMEFVPAFQRILLVCVPHPIEADWDPIYAPRLAGFPVNICYAALRGEHGVDRATYYFDPRTFSEDSRERRLRYYHGDMLLLSGGWYVTHTGLLRIARRKRCVGIQVAPVHKFCDPTSGRWAFKATVYRSKQCKGFVGYGDADPTNVASLVRGAEMRVAETRAVNRALRKAYGIGICSAEEIGSFPRPLEKRPPQSAMNGNGNGTGPKVRDRLCQIIRQHKLDPELVKAYAVDFCGTKTLREATREQVENFVQSLAEWAEKDRNALLCQLNSYARPKQEVVA